MRKGLIFTICLVSMLSISVNSVYAANTSSIPKNEQSKNYGIKDVPSGVLVKVETDANSKNANLDSDFSTASKVSANASKTLTNNPWGCVGQSNNPHSSGHKPGNITAESTTTCDSLAPQLVLYGELNHALGLGFEELIATDSKGPYISSKYIKVNPGVSCPVKGNTLYVEYGIHTIKDGSDTYLTTTTKSQWVDCSI